MTSFRPPRVYQYGNKYTIKVNKDLHEIATSLKDIEKVQKEVSKQIQIYPKKSPIYNPEIPKIGFGDANRGLSNFDIDNIMNHFGAFKHGYQGTIPSDYINKIKPTKKPFSFIINVDTSKQPGTHWIAIYIDPDREKEVDIFDSFARDPDDISPDFQDRLLTGLKQLIDKLHLPYMLKMKMNVLPQQASYDKKGNRTTTCGYYAMNFILDRMSGETFEEASNLDVGLKNIIDLESKQISKFKDYILKKKYI